MEMVPIPEELEWGQVHVSINLLALQTSANTLYHQELSIGNGAHPCGARVGARCMFQRPTFLPYKTVQIHPQELLEMVLILFWSWSAGAGARFKQPTRLVNQNSYHPFWSLTEVRCMFQTTFLP
jgi:hypothetical protein